MQSRKSTLLEGTTFRRLGTKYSIMASLSSALLLLLFLSFKAEAFSPARHVIPTCRITSSKSRHSTTSLKYAFHEEGDDDADDDEDDDGDFIDTDALGDWRTFRKNLALDSDKDSSAESSSSSKTPAPKSVSKENEELLKSQNKDLAQEYMTGVWAHETSTVSCFFLIYWDIDIDHWLP